MSGGFYARLRQSRKDDDLLAACVDRVVNQLEERRTSSDRPGILLGKIQSGKTRAFIGVIARSFDLDFGIALVLTKGTKTLSAQTVARLRSDLEDFIDEDEVIVFDIMQPPGRLTKSEQRRRLVIVAKKQSDNLDRLTEFFEAGYPELQGRKTLLIDDEADLASIRFVKREDQKDVEQGAIATKMDRLRNLLPKIAFLQVTATPYSLYLQPENYEAGPDKYVFKPKKPVFTELLPIHPNYVGGDDYFADFADEDPRRHLYVEVSRDEQDALRRADQRRINPDRVLESPNTKGLCRAIVTFIVAVCIRRAQQEKAGEKKSKYAMIIHNDTQKQAHAWQDQVIDWVFEALTNAAETNKKALRPLYDAAYADLSLSIAADHGRLPSGDLFSVFVEALQSEDVVRETVNSDKDVMALLDEKAELKLRTAFNIYVGGNILDRGITIPNLIAFYYGRNPKTMQADTVLQHSRMYGNRSRRDLAVTRFYTSQMVYDRLYKINKFENTLREAFESGAHEQGVVFIQADDDKKKAEGEADALTIRPCAPNKLSLSNVVAVRPSGLYLPTGFQTRERRVLAAAEQTLAKLIPPAAIDKRAFVEIDRALARRIIDEIEPTMDLPESDFEWNAMRGLLDYYANDRKDKKSRGNGRVLVLAETGRKLNQRKSGDKSGLSILGGGDLRRLVVDSRRTKPALVLLKQEGSKELDWSGHRFWWPILAAPSDVEPCVFATKVADEPKSRAQ
jgi:hypothetical protein